MPPPPHSVAPSVRAGRPLTRRRFLHASAATALAIGAAGALPACRGTLGGGARGRVVIVGAGLAGLIAAYELERDEFDVVLLEARNRVGGRLRTAHAPFYRAQTAELGGEFIDRNHRVLLGYIRRLGLDLDDLRRPRPGLQGVVYADGERRPYPEVVTPEVQAEIDRFRSEVQAVAAPVDPVDPPRGAAARLDERSVADLLDEVRVDRTARRILERDLRDEYTLEPERISLLFHAALTKLYGEAPEAAVQAYRVDGGNDRILEALLDEIGTKVDLDAPVDRIEQRRDGVRVHARSRREVDADFCIVTVPLPLLARIDVRPDLPPRLAEAAARLQYGEATKIALQYRRRFWLTEALSGNAITDLPIGTTWDATDRQAGATGILMAYASGEDGEALGRLTDSERIAQATEQMERVFPRARRSLDAGATAAWNMEPYSRGSYAVYAPGQVTRYWRTLREPVGRVYLAGDHCDAYTGYMEGAVRSGRRAARAIARRAG